MMQLGPYDGRKKRSRCLACAASHLKCSSSQPCSACTRRGMTCTYPTRQSSAAPVIVESAWTTTTTPKSFQQKRATARFNINFSLVRASRPSTDASAYYLHHFYAFVRRNDFTGKAAAVHKDLQQLSRVGQATYLRDAMLAIGAMHAANMGTNDIPDVVAEGDHTSTTNSLSLNTPRGGVRHRAALEYYASAVSGLSRTLAAAACDLPPGEDMRDAVLWTTLFLGFYELMNETPPGEGWRLHMVHGTGKALRASGAACCRRGRSRTFFLQARVFEVFRAIICSDATFLTEPEWTNLLEEMWVDGAADNEIRDDGERGWHPLDALLDVVAQCTKLRFRIRGFLAQCRDGLLTSQEIEEEGMSISSRAVSLRNALERWSSTYGDEGASGTVSSATVSSSNPISQTTDASMILAHVFCAAVNAYLSGIFDYEMDQWHAIGQQPPTLPRATLQLHVDTILRYAAPALANTNIAPILLLFPIRVAGARSHYPRQRIEVLKLLDVIGRMYAAATYYSAHLQRLWVRMAEEEKQEEVAEKAIEARTQTVIVTEVTT
ncbi:hypothetical protein Sste5346_006451 [Sporothrix stenoceras]|uniref:Zn(2)-C6 fungal-type domain-containing protein n=1 Tax=Sporothrix stenoceras TaxID=5173 RepID=A0ABR3YY09_9PEZI